MPDRLLQQLERLHPGFGLATAIIPLFPKTRPKAKQLLGELAVFDASMGKGEMIVESLSDEKWAAIQSFSVSSSLVLPIMAILLVAH